MRSPNHPIRRGVEKQTHHLRQAHRRDFGWGFGEASGQIVHRVTYQYLTIRERASEVMLSCTNKGQGEEQGEGQCEGQDEGQQLV